VVLQAMDSVMDPLAQRTTQTRLVLEAMLSSDRPLSGMEVCRATSLPSGTVYPILRRLTEARWAVGSPPPPVEGPFLGRPPAVMFDLRLPDDVREMLKGWPR
jgi:hypothetical protein